MDIELLTERIAHTETKQALLKAQRQLLDMLWQQTATELAALRAQLPKQENPQAPA